MRVLQSAGCMTPTAIIIYGLAGLLLLSQFGGPALNYLRSMGWEQVSGTITHTAVEDAWDTTGDRYIGQVIYSYEVNGVTYEGDQIDLRGQTFFGARNEAEQLVAPYPVGTSVTPYVDPANPNRAVLDRNLPGATWGIVGVGSALLLLSLVLGVRSLASRPQSSEKPKATTAPMTSD